MKQFGRAHFLLANSLVQNVDLEVNSPLKNDDFVKYLVELYKTRNVDALEQTYTLNVINTTLNKTSRQGRTVQVQKPVEKDCHESDDNDEDTVPPVPGGKKAKKESTPPGENFYNIAQCSCT